MTIFCSTTPLMPDFISRLIRCSMVIALATGGLAAGGALAQPANVNNPVSASPSTDAQPKKRKPDDRKSDRLIVLLILNK